MHRNVHIITDSNDKKLVLINDICFKGKKREDWKEVENYLKRYMGEFYEIAETSEKIFISNNFPDEYVGSESRISLKGAVAKAKANAAQGIPELIQIASNREYSGNKKKERATHLSKTVRCKPIFFKNFIKKYPLCQVYFFLSARQTHE